MPYGATVLDFAYEIHTKIGDHAIGARINHKIMPMTTLLNSGDQVQIITAENLSVSEEEATAEAKDLAAMQFAQYGMPNAPEDMVANFAKNILENKDQKQHIYEKLYEQKVIASIRGKVKVTEKAVSADEFAEIARSL